MEFHQSDFERLAEKIFTHICKEFDGLCVGTNECDFDAMKKSLPYDLEKDNTQSPTSNNEEQNESFISLNYYSMSSEFSISIVQKLIFYYF